MFCVNALQNQGLEMGLKKQTATLYCNVNRYSEAINKIPITVTFSLEQMHSLLHSNNVDKPSMSILAALCMPGHPGVQVRQKV